MFYIYVYVSQTPCCYLNANATPILLLYVIHPYRFTWNRGLVRILFPNFQKKNGTEHIASAMKASREFPHPSPKASYIDGPANGSRAPISDRSAVLAAVTDAA